MVVLLNSRIGRLLTLGLVCSGALYVSAQEPAPSVLQEGNASGSVLDDTSTPAAESVETPKPDGAAGDEGPQPAEIPSDAKPIEEPVVPPADEPEISEDQDEESAGGFEVGQTRDVSGLSLSDLSIASPDDTINTRAGLDDPGSLTRTADQGLGIRSEGVSRSEIQAIQAVDTGSLLQESDSIVSVTSQRRSALSSSPYIRGYRNGQIYTQADGAYYTAARVDLDTIVSKIEPGLIGNIDVISGPYGLRHGPGFAFINVDLIDTPRYEEVEHHLLSGFHTRLNGGQFALRETAYGGDFRSGYIASFSWKKGSDYTPGSGAPFEKIPSSYEGLNGFIKYSRDLSPEATLELQYNRYSEFDTEYPVQFFDINSLHTDALTVSHIVVDPYEHKKKRLDGWFNYTSYEGDTLRSGKRTPFPVVDRVESSLDTFYGITGSRFRAITDGNLLTTGARMSTTKGKDGEAKLSHGLDFRYTSQGIGEQFDARDSSNVLLPAFAADDRTNMPGASQINPGVFVEYEHPWTRFPRLMTKMGARADYVQTDADAGEVRSGGLLLNKNQLKQEDVLWAAYLIQQFEMNDRLKFTLAGGHSERVPDLIDRYADGLFLGIMQSGFSKVIGDTNLRKEQLWQVDAGVDYSGERLSGSAKYFYSIIEDYNLYEGQNAADPTGARLLFATNAELVTLTGFELQGTFDLSRRWSLFGSSRYLVGDDLDIQLSDGSVVDQPLFGISPFEGTLGVRLHDPCQGQRWGLEFAARMVATQDRIAGLRRSSISPGPLPIGMTDLESRTPGFTTFGLRYYYNRSRDLRFTAGVENLFDRDYYEHLDLRLPAGNGFDPTIAYRPGITPYFGFEIVR